jgi:hypothetical protein
MYNEYKQNHGCNYDIELTSMSTLDKCAEQVAENIATGKCVNRFFEYDPNDGDCDCCDGRDFDSNSAYTVYEIPQQGY